MGLFSKKKDHIDFDALFKEQYKSLNQVMMQAQNESDYMIKESLLEVVVEKYNELIQFIDQGAHFEREHFEALRLSAIKELQSIQDINRD